LLPDLARDIIYLLIKREGLFAMNLKIGAMLLATLAISATSMAQTVTKVMGSDVLISIPPDHSAATGDSVVFSDAALNSVGRGKIKKVSEGGTAANVEVVSGEVRAGNRAEVLGKNGESARASGPKGMNGYLSSEDSDILARGEISTTRYIIGGILATYPGFGIGHAVQMRYSSRGWIFTVGELGSAAVLVAGLSQCVSTTIGFGTSQSRTSYDCSGSGLITLGALGIVGFRIWEIIDGWVAPIDLNRRYRELKNREALNAPLEPKWYGGLLPQSQGATLLVGLSF
jgi:hypothetical protein